MHNTKTTKTEEGACGARRGTRLSSAGLIALAAGIAASMTLGACDREDRSLVDPDREDDGCSVDNGCGTIDIQYGTYQAFVSHGLGEYDTDFFDGPYTKEGDGYYNSIGWTNKAALLPQNGGSWELRLVDQDTNAPLDVPAVYTISGDPWSKDSTWEVGAGWQFNVPSRVEACGESSTPGVTTMPSLYQAATHSSGDLVHAHNSSTNMSVTGAPSDTDPSRWGLTYDDHGKYLLYHMSKDSTKLHRFVWNGAAYEYQRTLRIEPSGNDDPEDSPDFSRGFAITHFDGHEWSSFWNINKAGTGLVRGSFYGDTDEVIDLPYSHTYWDLGDLGSADLSHWAIVDYGSSSLSTEESMNGVRFYARDGSSNRLIEWGNFHSVFNPDNNWFYYHAEKTGNTIDYRDFPADTDHSDFGMMHDGGTLRFYLRPTATQ